jgi:hypothetical protein
MLEVSIDPHRSILAKGEVSRWRSGERGNKSAPSYLGRDGELDGLLEPIRGRAGLRLHRRRPVPKRGQTDLSHILSNSRQRIELARLFDGQRRRSRLI